jgi:hypothetical protein
MFQNHWKTKMIFINFYEKLKSISNDYTDIKKFQSDWKESIISEINSVLPLERLSPTDDLTIFALYKLLQRFYAERGSEGFDDIVKLWANLIKKEQDNTQLEKVH